VVTTWRPRNPFGYNPKEAVWHFGGIRMITIDLTGKNALVTGGTRGIGRAITRRLAEAGANTAAVYRGDEQAARDSLAERNALSGGAHRNLQADIGDERQVEGLIDRVIASYAEGLDILVLNAGIGLGGKVTETDSAQWRRLLDVNLGSAFLLARGLIPILRRGGSIVAIGSGAGHDPIAGLALYGATKAGLAMFIADLAQEVGPEGIRANVVSPGSTDTSFQGNAPSPSEKQGSATHNALRRRGVPDDVAGVVLLLCSDLASFVTGQSIRVNGGAI
jgi:3-oxoacyl-[acyl-carrier protein] reductase